MASQTGTLKFRQSDGTYTELYPKTTIAQVDGLQTQLDNINTSLQNKVGINTNATLKALTLTASSIAVKYENGVTGNLRFYPYGCYLQWSPNGENTYNLRLDTDGCKWSYTNSNTSESSTSQKFAT